MTREAFSADFSLNTRSKSGRKRVGFREALRRKAVGRAERLGAGMSAGTIAGRSATALAVGLFCVLCLFVSPGTAQNGTAESVQAPAVPQKNIRVTFIPQWEPQAQFAGYFCALQRGFYRARGLDVTILRGGPTRPPSRMLVEGKADFGTLFLGKAIIDRASGEPLVNLAQMVRKGSLLLIAKKGRGISAPKDLHGKRVSMWGDEFRIQPRMFFAKHEVGVVSVPQGFTVDLFLRDGVDAASAMRYNEYHAVLNSGWNPEELTVFDMAEAGLDFPEDGLYCLESFWREKPEVARAFVEASLEGWLWAFEHEKEALDIVMSYVNGANLPTNRVHQKWMLDHLREAMLPGGDRAGFGRLDQGAYTAVAAALLKEGLIRSIPDYGEFHVRLR